jgi:hypothetical protein
LRTLIRAVGRARKRAPDRSPGTRCNRHLAAYTVAATCLAALLVSCGSTGDNNQSQQRTSHGARPVTTSQGDGGGATATSTAGKAALPTSPGYPTPAKQGSSGRETASWVIAENAKPGNRDWVIPANLGGASIRGYAGTTQTHAGSTVELYVSTTARSFRVEAYRMGFYGGADARIWASQTPPGHSRSAVP